MWRDDNEHRLFANAGHSMGRELGTEKKGKKE
jgi:hypothetical protein